MDNAILLISYSLMIGLTLDCLDQIHHQEENPPVGSNLDQVIQVGSGGYDAGTIHDAGQNCCCGQWKGVSKHAGFQYFEELRICSICLVLSL